MLFSLDGQKQSRHQTQVGNSRASVAIADFSSDIAIAYLRRIKKYLGVAAIMRTTIA